MKQHIVNPAFRVLIGLVLLFSTTAFAEIDSRSVGTLDLGVEPVDMAVSPDGQQVYILSRGKVLFYSVMENKLEGSIEVDKAFDRISHSSLADLLILTDGAGKRLEVIQFEISKEIDVSGLPFKGPENAPVVIAVFSDYQ